MSDPQQQAESGPGIDPSDFEQAVNDFESGGLTAAEAWKIYGEVDPRSTSFHRDATRFHALLIQRRADRELGLTPSAMLLSGRDHAETALAATTGRSPKRAVVLSNYSILLLESWFHDDVDDFLRSSIEVIEQALELGHPNPSMVRTWHVNAASCCSDAGFRFNDDGYFQRAAEHARKVVGPDNDPVVIASRFNLAETLSSRFRLVGDVALLDEAAEVSQKILSYAEASPWAAKILEGHASILGERHRLVGGKRDLAASINLGRQALKVGNEPERVARNLSMRLARRYEIERDPSDLLEAESLARLAADRAGTGAMATGRIAIWVSRVTDVARRLGRWESVPAALFLAVERLERAEIHPDRPWLANVVSQLIDETLTTAFEVEGFNRALKLRLADDAVSGVEPGSPRVPDYLSWRAVARLQNRRTPDVNALNNLRIVHASLDDARRAVEHESLNLAVLGRVQISLALTAGVAGASAERRALAEAVPHAVTSWLANGVGVDRSDLAVARLAGLGSRVCEAILDHANMAESEPNRMENAAMSSVALRSFWLDRLDGAELAALEAAEPDLARRWAVHGNRARIAQHREAAVGDDVPALIAAAPPSTEADRRALLRDIRRVLPGFGQEDGWSRSLQDMSNRRPVCIMISSPDGLRCFAFVDGNAASVHLPVDWTSLRRLLGHALHGPQRLGTNRPLLEAFSTVIAAIGPAAIEIKALFRGVGDERPLAILGDGLARSLPWVAAPVGPGRHLGDELSLVTEPAPHLVAMAPSTIPTDVSILGGGDESLPWAALERRWLTRSRSGTELPPRGTASEGLSTDTFLHVMAHGVADREQPRNSGIVLDDGLNGQRILQAHDLADAGVVPRTVLLAACSLAQSGTTWETSAIAAPVIDTFRVFGARSVAGYLSPCGDQAATILSVKIHQEIASGAATDLPSAVRSTQQWAKCTSDAEVVSWAEDALDADVTLNRPIRNPAIWGNLTVSGW